MKVKIYKLTIKFSVIAILLFATTGCYYDQVYVAPEAPPEGEISYATDVQTIWDTKGCLNCHNTGATAPILTADVSYNNLVPSKVDLANPSQSAIYTVLDGFMRGSVTAADEAIVLEWIEQGAQNN